MEDNRANRLSKIVGEDLWTDYWKKCDDLHRYMNEIQATQDKLRKMIEDKFIDKE